MTNGCKSLSCYSQLKTQGKTWSEHSRIFSEVWVIAQWVAKVYIILYLYIIILHHYIIISIFVSHTNMDSLLDLMNTSLPLRPCPNCLNQFCRSEGHQFFWENMLQWGILNSGWGCALVCSQNSNWAKNYKLSFCAQFLPSIIDKASLSSLRIRIVWNTKILQDVRIVIYFRYF